VSKSTPRGERRRRPTPESEPLPLGELQAAVLRDLWTQGESPVRDVAERLRASGLELAYTTVLTVMVRLAQRGLLVRRRVGRRDVYRAAVAPEGLATALSREAVDRLLDAHGDAVLAAFADRLRAGDPRDLARLRELLDQPEA